MLGSKECQKKHWPNHKEFCKRGAIILQLEQHKKQIRQNQSNSSNAKTSTQTKNE